MQNRYMSRRASGLKLISSSMVLAAFAIVSALAMACRSSQSPQADIAVNAPANGVVRSVLVGDGAAIEKDAAIIEIAISSDQAGEELSNEQKDKDAQRARVESAARSDAVAAEADANRTSVELRRIEPLVKRGLASQSELDKERVQNQDAQARLQRARERVNSVEQQRKESSVPGGPNEEIVAVRSPTAGKVHQIRVQAGQQVTAGQTLASVSSGS